MPLGVGMFLGGMFLGFLIAGIIIAIIFVAVYFSKKDALTNVGKVPKKGPLVALRQ